MQVMPVWNLSFQNPTQKLAKQPCNFVFSFNPVIGFLTYISHCLPPTSIPVSFFLYPLGLKVQDFHFYSFWLGLLLHVMSLPEASSLMVQTD